MPVARHPGSTSLVDVLDQGIRFTEGPRLALAGSPRAEQVRIVVEAVETHLERPVVPPGKTGTGA